jgi:SsrA-binding protein
MTTQLRANGDQIAENRRARFDYAIEDTYEAGLILTGSEVKSLRLGLGSLAGAFAAVDRDGLPKVFGLHIDPYTKSGAHLQHEPKRPRTLLLKQKELKKIAIALERGGMTLVPLKLYFTPKGKVKILLGLAKGKKSVDKRATTKQRDWDRDKARALRTKNK